MCWAAEGRCSNRPSYSVTLVPRPKKIRESGQVQRRCRPAACVSVRPWQNPIKAMAWAQAHRLRMTPSGRIRLFDVTFYARFHPFYPLCGCLFAVEPKPHMSIRRSPIIQQPEQPTLKYKSAVLTGVCVPRSGRGPFHHAPLLGKGHHAFEPKEQSDKPDFHDKPDSVPGRIVPQFQQ